MLIFFQYEYEHFIFVFPNICIQVLKPPSQSAFKFVLPLCVTQYVACNPADCNRKNKF